MSYLIDTHCHLHDREFFTEAQAKTMLENAHARGIRQIICIGTNNDDSLAARDFAKKHDNVFWTYGIHPEFARDSSCSGTRTKPEHEPSSKLVAIGEVGLDYHYPGYDRQKQIELLEQMLDLAIQLDLPCSLHVRDAFDDFFAVIKNFPKLKPSVLHSFSDSPENLAKALSRDFYIGINGLATFANLDCYKDLASDFLSRVILETDAPFLTPVPNRGKINEPGNVADVASWLAKKIGVSSDKIAEWTTKNARTIFNLPHPEPNHGADPRA